MIFIIIALLPFILMNIAWGGTGPNWLFWGSRFYIGLIALIVDLIYIFYPYQFNAWFQRSSENDDPSRIGRKLLKYRVNGFVILILCFVYIWLVIMAYLRCPFIIC